MERVNDLKEKKEDIQKMLKNTEPFSKLNAQMCNKDIIILLGRTRAGKSTLANYLLGYKLKSVKDTIGNTYKLEMLDAEEGPQIGRGSVSATKTPTVHTLPDGGILIDSPGFEDNRGISQDIFNAICINHIRFAKSVKFVLVCYIGDLLNDNVQNFTNLLEKMAALVINFEEIYKSVCILFTKDQNDITLNQLRKLMNDNILRESGLKVDKRLLPTLTKNTNLIGIFKSPMREGEIFVKQLDVNVKNAIDACSYVDVANLKIQFPLADESKVILSDIYLDYPEPTYFELEIERTMKCIKNYFDVDEYVLASYGKELYVVKHKVLKPLGAMLKLLLENDINNLEELKRALQAVMDVRKLELSTDFNSHFEFILLLDNALLLEENFQTLIIENCKKSTSKLLVKIQHLIDKIDAEYSCRSDENILLLYEAIYFKYGYSTFQLGIELAKAKIISSVQTGIVGIPDNEPLMPETIVASEVDIAKVTDAIIKGAAIAKSAIAKATAVGVIAGGAGAAGMGATGGAAASAVGGVAASGSAVSAATAGAVSAATAGAVSAATAGAAAVGTVVAGGAGVGAAVASSAGAAATGTAIAGATASGATTSGMAAIGASTLGAVACGAGIFVAGVAVSSVYFSMQNSLTNRYKTRCKQNRDINN